MKRKHATKRIGMRVEIKDRWIVEWSQKQAQLHISTNEYRPVKDWVVIARVNGTYDEASAAADKWLSENPEAKAAYQKRRGY